MLIVVGISTVYSIASIFPEIEGQIVSISLFALLALVNGILAEAQNYQ